MRQEQNQQLARLIKVSRFCQRHARVLAPVTPGFAGQVREVGDSVAALSAVMRERESEALQSPSVRLRDARQALYAQVLTLHRIARVLNPDVGIKGTLLAPQANRGVEYLMRAARQLEAHVLRKRPLFISRGAPEDCWEQLRGAMAVVEQVRQQVMADRGRRAQRRLAMRVAFLRGANAVVCLDSVVGKYCGDVRGGGRRGQMLKQWRAIVGRVSAPYPRTPRGRRTATVQQNDTTG